MQNEHFSLSPVQNYSSPAYPSRETKPAETLKKLPVRWAKNAAVLACLGALSLGVLTACSPEPEHTHWGGAAAGPFYVAYPTEQEAASCDDGTHGVAGTVGGDWYAENGRELDVEVRTHWGGSGAGPFYVAYLTEQEALRIIRNRLCEAGICFEAPLPDYVATVETSWSEATAALSLFDERTRQGIVFPTPWSWQDEFQWGMSGEEIEHALQQDFAQRFDLSVTFMQNPGESMCDSDWWDREFELTFTEEEKQEAGQILKERLLLQVDTFLDHLRGEGVLPT